MTLWSIAHRLGDLIPHLGFPHGSPGDKSYHRGGAKDGPPGALKQGALWFFSEGWVSKQWPGAASGFQYFCGC